MLLGKDLPQGPTAVCVPNFEDPLYQQRQQGGGAGGRPRAPPTSAFPLARVRAPLAASRRDPPFSDLPRLGPCQPPTFLLLVEALGQLGQDEPASG